MFEKIRSKFAALTLALLASMAALPAAASSGIDVTEATTKIGDAAVAGAAIGLAVLVMLIGIRVFKWVRSGM